MSKYLEGLNQAQQRAVQHGDGPMLIVAGAGTGKTTVLINRLAYLIEQGVPAEQILLVTFTDKAAGELTERADELLPYGYFDHWIETFHSLSSRLLKIYGLEIGVPTDFKTITTVEAWMLIKRNIARFNLKYFRPLGAPDKYISDLVAHFSKLKDQNIWPEEYLDYVAGLKKANSAQSTGDEAEALDVARLSELAEAYHVYNQLLLERKLLDFGDQINYCVKLLKERPNVARILQRQFRYIMVDEFQDTNLAQYELIKLLAQPDNNLVAVGDDDQAIYKFRGASLSNILQFKDDFPQAVDLVLTDNYRSGQAVLDKSYNLIINNNPNRLEVRLGLDKKLRAGKDLKAGVEHWSLVDEPAETQAVVGRIGELHEAALADWADIAILTRSNRDADRFVKELESRGIPAHFMSRKGLYLKPVIVDTLAFCKLLDNYHESSALFRVLSTPAFRMPHDDLMELSRQARHNNRSLYDSLRLADTMPEVSGIGQAAAGKLVAMIVRLSGLAKTASATKVIATIVRDILASYLDRDRQVEEYRFLEQLYRKALSLETVMPEAKLKDFVEYLEMEMDAGETGSLPSFNEDSDTVKVATIHSAKGLEFKYVFVVSMVEERFPSRNQGGGLPIPDGMVKDKNAEGGSHLEEERRLCYVAMTRAKLGLYLTGFRDSGGVRKKKPSRFIAEIGVSTLADDIAVSDGELGKAVKRLDEPEPAKTFYLLPEKFSFSQLEAYDNCPLQYKFAHILKIPAEDKPNLVFGRVIHAVLHDLLAPLIPSVVAPTDLFDIAPQAASALTEERLWELFDRHWTDIGYQSQEQAAEFKASARVMLLKIFNLTLENKQLQIYALERPFSFKVGDYWLKGSIDRIDRKPDGSLMIIDYKTGQPKNKLEYRQKRQLLIYQLALEELTGLKVSSLAFYYMESGELLEFTAKESDLAKVQNEIAETIKSIVSLDFTATPTELCKYCDFRGICEFRRL
ncbi:MAG: ATP-dependent DNA helicase [Candidatus Falkowbacteria bacterium]